MHSASIDFYPRTRDGQKETYPHQEGLSAATGRISDARQHFSFFLLQAFQWTHARRTIGNLPALRNLPDLPHGSLDFGGSSTKHRPGSSAFAFWRATSGSEVTPGGATWYIVRCLPAPCRKVGESTPARGSSTSGPRGNPGSPRSSSPMPLRCFGRDMAGVYCVSVPLPAGR